MYPPVHPHALGNELPPETAVPPATAHGPQALARDAARAAPRALGRSPPPSPQDANHHDPLADRPAAVEHRAANHNDDNVHTHQGAKQRVRYPGGKAEAAHHAAAPQAATDGHDPPVAAVVAQTKALAAGVLNQPRRT